MYGTLSKIVLDLMHLPTRPPDPPSGGYKSVQVFRASPRWLTYRRILYLCAAGFTAIVLLFAFTATLLAPKVWATALVVAIAICAGLVLYVSWFCVRLDYDLRTYIVTDRSMRVREGAWVFKEMTLTYANVQNVQVLQGPLQRLFKIEDLRVDTAGGGGAVKGEGAGNSGHSVTLAGLENAREVRDLILAYVKNNARGSGLGDLDDSDSAPRASAGSSRAVVDALKSVRDSAALLRRAAESRLR
jgi:membrane protein YdbS with pleckstrin-like domain